MLVDSYMGGWHEFRDTIVPRELEIFVAGTGGDVTIQMFYGPDPTAAGTAMCAATQATTAGGVVVLTTFSVAYVPEDLWIWCEVTSAAATGTTLVTANFAYNFQ